MQRLVRQIILDVDDGDMARLEALARERDSDIDALARLAVGKLLGGEDGSTTVQQPIVAYGAFEEHGGWAEVPHDPAEKQAARIEALRGSSGLVKERVAVEIDGLAYQKEMRAEWR
jgi:hypothetical protein